MEPRWQEGIGIALHLAVPLVRNCVPFIRNHCTVVVGISVPFKQNLHFALEHNIYQVKCISEHGSFLLFPFAIFI